MDEDISVSPQKKLRGSMLDNVNKKTSITCTNVPDCLFEAKVAGKHFGKFGRVQRIALLPKKQMCVIEYDHPNAAERAVLNAGAYDGFMFDVTRAKQRVCTNVPDCLFEAKVAGKHFGKFGRVQRIALLPKKQMCVIEYDHPNAAERAVLNAGAYDGFMFDVTRAKQRVRRKSSKDEDPDWLPDAEVAEELNAMSGGGVTYRVPRKKVPSVSPSVALTKPRLMPPLMKKRPQVVTPKRTRPPNISQPAIAEAPVVITATTLGNREAAAELDKLRARVSITPDEKWRTLDARDRILRAWGGAGSRVKVGGATIGTCPDMCPEKELLHRLAEHQVMTLETIPDSDGLLEPWRAVKQYSRSSADQEIPMCYELRPAQVLMRTCAYLLYKIADTKRQVTLADWFHFMWDRFRGIRKDITQQALCCAESIKMVEICARFHAHCGARLADLEHTQFDQKLNTDNLTKCLQTLKHMYADVTPEYKPNEAEFRGYIALLNLGDANFWWEIQQLPEEIQKSESIKFSLQIYNTLDNNNYVKFFRLVQKNATYLQACILLRYFNDVRARALARIVKAYAPRGGSRYPAEDMMNILAFESVESMKAFINHYGLRFAKNETELTIILNRNHFIEDSDPYPVSRAINLIESKIQSTVGEIISGGHLMNYDFENLPLYSSFNIDGRLKETALLAEDMGYNTVNDSGKDVQALKLELQKLTKDGSGLPILKRVVEPKKTTFVKPEETFVRESVFSRPTAAISSNKFSFQPAIQVAPTEVIVNSPEKELQESPKPIFTFSKPQKTETNIFTAKMPTNLFSRQGEDKTDFSKPNVFTSTNDQKNTFKIANSVLKPGESSDIFKKPVNSIFGQKADKPVEVGNIFTNSKLFSSQRDPKNVFSKSGNSLFAKSQEPIDKNVNIFAKPLQEQPSEPRSSTNVFSRLAKPTADTNTFKLGNNVTNSIPHSNGDPLAVTSPGSLFKSANQPLFTTLQNNDKAQTVADNIFNSVKLPQNDVYDFDPNDTDNNELEKEIERKMREEELKREKENIRKQEQEKLELQRKEEERKREAQRKLEEFKKLEEIRKKEEEKRKREEEKIQEELRKKVEEQKKMELKRIAEEKERKFKERVDKESQELTGKLVFEVIDETSREVLKEEIEEFNKLLAFANELNENLCMELCNEICASELKAEMFRTKMIMKKWFCIWRKHFIRNFKRRSLLEDTPIWLPDRSPLEEARYLKRTSEKVALENMNAIHRGYRFVGELKHLPRLKPYNILDIIRSTLLKRMKQIEYPYDKCFFWKVSLVSPGEKKWMYRKIHVEKWIQDVFSDRKKHDISDSLIYVEKQSWNSLMDFAISVSLLDRYKFQSANEALNGTNGVLLYATENDSNIDETIEMILKQKYQYQIIPIAVIMPLENNFNKQRLEAKLTIWENNNIISAYKLFYVDSVNISDSLNICTKSALKWISRNYPKTAPLEIDCLKSICQRYLGNEIWCRLKSDKDERTKDILKDLKKLVICYNTAVDKLCSVITDENLFNYPSFPLEFIPYLDSSSPYPKPYEFIPSSAKNSDNTRIIKIIMQKLKLPDPSSTYLPKSILGMQQQIRSFCKQINWFSNPDEVVCKAVAVMPNELCDLNMPNKTFTQYFEQFNLVDVLNVIVYEKINSLNNFDNRFAVYLKPVLEEYRNSKWFLEIDVYSVTKHIALEYEDDIDFYIEAKRRKIASNSMDQLMFEEKDCSLVEENIQKANQSISNIRSYKNVVTKLEKQLNKRKKKSDKLEKLLRTALSNV